MTLGRRGPAVAAAAVLTVGACAFVPMWHRLVGPAGGGWFVPGDLFGTALAADAYGRGQFAAVYTPATALVTFPGVAVALAPVVALAHAVGGPLVHPGPAGVRAPAAWAVVSAGALALSLPALFAADGLAEAIGVTRRRRWALAAGEAVALWNVTVWWGHPEDALAVALVCWCARAVLGGRHRRAAWLAGLAVCVQPLALLAVPALAVRLEPRQRPEAALRLVAPSALVLAGPLLAAPVRTLRVLTDQPNFPGIDHVTPWLALSPGLGHQVVAAGPLRLVALVVVAAGGTWAGRRAHDAQTLVWILAASMAVRVVFEPVMVAYYVWPVLALALVAAARRGAAALGAALALSTFATVFGDAAWRGNWSWWAVEVAALAALLAVALAPRALAAPPGGRRAVVAAVECPVVATAPFPGR